jgi:hypothetical protein
MKRTLILAAVAAMLGSVPAAVATPKPYAEGCSTVRVDASRVTEFQALQPKRADLRVAVARDGFEAAYAAWAKQASSCCDVAKPCCKDGKECCKKCSGDCCKEGCKHCCKQGCTNCCKAITATCCATKDQKQSCAHAGASCCTK